MDLILHNGQIFTMKDSKDIYSAIAIKNGIIKAIGNDDLLNLKDKDTSIIDLNGKYVFPGFNDSHMHLLGHGASLSQVDLSQARSIDDVIAMTKAYITKNNVSPGKWVMGRGWNQDFFETDVMPTHQDLDQVSTDHFIFLRRACGHVATCNSKILDSFMFSTSKTIIDGGEYENGIFKENALELVTRNMPMPTKEDLKEWIQTGVQDVLSKGITSVQSDDLCVFPEQLIPLVFETLNELDKDNELDIRVYEQSLFRNKHLLQESLDKGYQQNHGHHMFRMGPLKILGDGSLGGRTAWLNKPYADDPSTQGIHMYEQDELNDYIALAQQHHIASAVHCIGDQMLDSALNAIEYAQSKYPDSSLRHGIVHCQITSIDQLKRMKDMNVMAYVQPIFLDYDAHIVYDRVGALADTSYNWKTMMDLDLRMSFGSDAPVDSVDPLKGIHCAVTRTGLNGTPKDGYLKDQQISIYNAIYNYTVESAYASYEENNKGRLLPNFVADLVVIEGPVFQDILSCDIHMTIVNGLIKYKNK